MIDFDSCDLVILKNNRSENCIHRILNENPRKVLKCIQKLEIRKKLILTNLLFNVSFIKKIPKIRKLFNCSHKTYVN